MEKNAERNQKIYDDYYKKEKTQSQIARENGVSVSRVKQIVDSHQYYMNKETKFVETRKIMDKYKIKRRV